jgi:hypothetical protein
MFGLELFKKKDEKLSRQYIEQILTYGPETCEIIAEEVNKQTQKSITFPVNDHTNIETSIAILATSLAFLSGGHSESLSADRGAKIEELCRVLISRDFGLSPEESDDLITTMNKYENVFEKAISIYKNPFGDIAGFFICQCFGPQRIHEICLSNSDTINPQAHEIIGDLITISIMENLKFWVGK